MSGIIFFKTQSLEQIQHFYCSLIGMNLWSDQDDCITLQHGNLLLGFCNRGKVDNPGMITFFYRTKAEIDRMYEKLKQWITSERITNEKHSIYHFFATDPEKRILEFKCFLQPIALYASGEQMLVERRSIRQYADMPVTDKLLYKVFEMCRYSPTSKNSQSFYFIVIRNKKLLNFFAELRGASTAPIGRAPVAVAICADNNKTQRPDQDGCIAAYHFILAAWTHGLGTCWMAALNRDDVKEALGIPKGHYVATITPVGYPAQIPSLPLRRKAQDFIKFLN